MSIVRNVPITPALRRRFVGRNFCYGFAGHIVYVLSGTLYAVTSDSGTLTITATCPAMDAGGTQADFDALQAAMVEAWQAQS